MLYLSTSEVVLHDEALYQVYVPLPLPFANPQLTSLELYIRLSVCPVVISPKPEVLQLCKFNQSDWSKSLFIIHHRYLSDEQDSLQSVTVLFLAAGRRLWNSLSHVVTSAPTSAALRNQLKTFLFSHSFSR